MGSGRRRSSDGWSRYGNAESGVVRYALVEHGIALEFRDGKRYLYDDVRPGAAHVAHMIELARAGRGLATYVSQHVREHYRRRL